MYLITGGGSGIGRSLALALAKRKKSVMIVGRKEERLQETASHSPLISYLCADVATTEGLDLIAAKLSSVPKITALINNAAVIEPICALKDISIEDWHHALNTNVDAALFLPQKLYKQLQNGRVLNIGSGAAYFAVKGWVAYCVSKAALAMLTRCWQIESKSVAFASVMPGIIDTDMQELIRNDKHMDTAQVNYYKKLKEQNHLVSTETVAEFLVWLLLDIPRDLYVSQEWDIYDTAQHPHWLKPPHKVPHWDI